MIHYYLLILPVIMVEGSRTQWYMALMSALGKQRQEDFCELKASLVYRVAKLLNRHLFFPGLLESYKEIIPLELVMKKLTTWKGESGRSRFSLTYILSSRPA